MNTGDVGTLGLGVVFGFVGWSLFSPLGAVPAFLVGTWVGGRLATLSEQIESLEARIVELEAERDGGRVIAEPNNRRGAWLRGDGREPRTRGFREHRERRAARAKLLRGMTE
ncbi:hypothetical protein [Halogranum amylolyticum]|uniref:hypothetical protein n=1 Tax=Halogranum amylolyticum TaxID=660520 RepID=UPI000A90F738|nr:hypothetical protein [Halogranum amylolyticum]